MAVRELPKDVLKMAFGLISPSGLAGHRCQLCNVTVSLHLPTMATCSFTVGTPASSSHAGPHKQPPATGGRLSNILQICSIYLVNNALHCNEEQSRFGEERRSPRPRSAPRHRLRASVAGLGSGFPRDIRQQRRHSSDSLCNLHRWPHVR